MCLCKIRDVFICGMIQCRQKLSDYKNFPASVIWDVSTIHVLSLLTFKCSKSQEKLMIIVTREHCLPAPGIPFPLSCYRGGGPFHSHSPARPCGLQWAGGFPLWRRRWPSLTKQSPYLLFLLKSDTTPTFMGDPVTPKAVYVF